MIPSYFKIEILAIRDEFVTQGHKGLNLCLVYINFPANSIENDAFKQKICKSDSPHHDKELAVIDLSVRENTKEIAGTGGKAL